MKSFDTDLKKYADKVHLKALERRELRERVLSYMEYHPLPKQRSSISIDTINSQQFVTISFNTIYTRIAGGAFALLLLVGLPIAAERSVPGDVLYPIKTQINEGIRTQLANSPYEKVVLETTLLERRIAEARLLASEGKLTEEVEAAIAVDVKEHADAAQAGLAELKVDDAEEAAIAEIAFGSALEVQSAVLDTNTDLSTSSEGITEIVKAAQVEASAQQGTTTASYEGLTARIEFETTRAYELFEVINDSATDDERADIERRLADIERKIVGAHGLQELGVEGSEQVLTDAIGLIQKLIVFMTDIDVRDNVALEALVPVELTLEERGEAVQGVLKDVIELHTAVEIRMVQIDSEGILEKVSLGMETLSGLIATTSILLETGNMAAAENTVAEAFAFASDLDQMTIPFIFTDEIEVIEEPVDPVDPVDPEEDPIEEVEDTELPTEEVIELPVEDVEEPIEEIVE